MRLLLLPRPPGRSSPPPPARVAGGGVAKAAGAEAGAGAAVAILVAVGAAHRGSALAACEVLMGHLKTQAPFWKKETTPQGMRWVDARVSDDAALARWNPTDPANPEAAR